MGDFYMGKKLFYILGGGLIIFLSVIMFAVITEPKVDPYILADCLSEKGVIMAGTDTCPACIEQKNQFGAAFEKIDYINCHYDDWCAENKITRYPTWVFPNGTQYRGVQNLYFLSVVAECDFNGI
jgi:hypothetical protein